MQSVRRPAWQQTTAVVSLSTCGAMTGFAFAHGTVADMTSPTSMPFHMTAMDRPASVGRQCAAVGDRERGQVLPADGAGQDAGRNGGAYLAG